MKRVLSILLSFVCSAAFADPDCSDYDPETVTYNGRYLTCHSIAIEKEYSSTKKKLFALIDPYMEKPDTVEHLKQELIALKRGIGNLERLSKNYAQEECYISLYGNGGSMEAFNHSACTLNHKKHSLTLLKNLLAQCEENPPGGGERLCAAF